MSCRQMIVFGSAHVFNPHVVVTSVWSLDEEMVDVMATIASLADVQRNVTLAITTGHNVEADDGIQFFKFGNIFDWHGEVEARQVEGVLVWLIVGKTIGVLCNWMDGERMDQTKQRSRRCS